MLFTLSSAVMPLVILSLVAGVGLATIYILALVYSYDGWISTRLNWGLMGFVYQVLMAATTYRTLLVIRIVSASDASAKKIHFPIKGVMWTLAAITEGTSSIICFIILPNVYSDSYRQDWAVRGGLLCIGFGNGIKSLIAMFYFLRLMKIFRFALTMAERSSRINAQAISAKKKTIAGLERAIITSAARVLVSVFWVVAAFLRMKWFLFHVSCALGFFTVLGTYKFLRGFKKKNALLANTPTVTTTPPNPPLSGMLPKRSLVDFGASTETPLPAQTIAPIEENRAEEGSSITLELIPTKAQPSSSEPEPSRAEELTQATKAEPREASEVARGEEASEAARDEARDVRQNTISDNSRAESLSANARLSE